MSGLLQDLHVSADTPDQLRHVLALALSWHRGATHYVAGNKDGFDWIELRWCGSNNAIQLPYPLDSEEKLFNFVCGWLETAKRGARYDTDGDLTKGWSVTKGDFYALYKVHTEWIIYGK